MPDAVTAFFAIWAETDADKRRATLTDVMAETFSYCDPNAPEMISDLEALNSYIGMFTQYAPGASAQVVRTGETKGHHRVTVAFRMADGKEQLGQYFVELDADGRAQRMVGFAGLGEPE
ncbi:molecular chaperone GroEL [Shimia sp. MMG029]|uniref:molecular chaperone GroEL n=1 Tax=Shimia sp. MMG029 TaxID=3021978 RepID=UPI0022FF29C0|nr:molecular chaperone GroEL [Shimia sp. MMG029]MDA5558656.1 molecular chaperone GroEL [Shimia sp. MMG029]